MFIIKFILVCWILAIIVFLLCIGSILHDLKTAGILDIIREKREDGEIEHKTNIFKHIIFILMLGVPILNILIVLFFVNVALCGWDSDNQIANVFWGAFFATAGIDAL